MRKAFVIFLTFVLIIFSISGCSNKQTPKKEAKGPVTVASMIDSEGAVLGKMIVMLLEADGFQVKDKTEFGTPDILRRALMENEVDLVIDYTGSGQYYHENQDTAVWSDPIAGYELTQKLDREKNNIRWLQPAKANNTEALAMKADFAAKHNIKTMEDFARYVNEGGEVKLICSASFSENTKGLLGFEEAYGFKLKKNQMIVLAAGNTAEMIKALYEDRDGINVSLVYGTDGALDKMNLVVIEDPKNIPPVYLPTPVLRGEVADQYPEIEGLLQPAFASLSLEVLQTLNSRVAYDGEDAKAVAKEYLEKNNLFK